MIKSSFLNSIQKRIEKFDIRTLRDFLSNFIDDFDNLTTVFNSMYEGVLVLDNDESIMFYNKVASKFLNLKTQLFDIDYKKVIKDEKILKIINDLLENKDGVTSFEIKLDNNRFYLVSTQSLVREGKIEGSIIIITDITITKENEMKLRQMESLAALTTISAGVAHEIKNPLGAISIHVQLLDQQLRNCKCKNSDELQYSTRVVTEEIERLSDIVSNFLFTVRPLKPELVPVNMTNFLDRFIELVLPELENHKIKFVKDYEILPEAWVDEKYLRQAILNLVQNSLASLKENGRLEIEAYQENNYIYMNVIDNGDGIPEEIQTKIFDPYFTTKKFGTGLGLTIVYKIIKEHNGDISFTSKKGETIFSIRLPVKQINTGLIEYNGENNGN